jgi:hypothetical protein
MPRTKTGFPQTHRRAQQLAKDAADHYFAALTAEIPFDNAPGDVDLIDACNQIQDAINEDGDKSDADSAMNAGYLLGIEIGRRLGGGGR